MEDTVVKLLEQELASLTAQLGKDYQERKRSNDIQAEKKSDPFSFLVASAKEANAVQKTWSHEVNRLDEILENIQSRNSAAEHIVQDIRQINQRNLASAVSFLEKIDRIQSQNLLFLIENGVKEIQDIETKFNRKLEKQREEFHKSFNCEHLLRSGLEERYQQMKSSISSILKSSFERSNRQIDMWISLDNECFDWSMGELRSTREAFQGPQYQKLRVSSHQVANSRVSSYCERVHQNSITHVQQSQRALLKMRKAEHLAARWQLETKKSFDDWLADTVRGLEQQYMDYMDSLSQEISSLYSLDLELKMVYHQRRCVLASLGHASSSSHHRASSTASKEEVEEEVKDTSSSASSPWGDRVEDMACEIIRGLGGEIPYDFASSSPSDGYGDDDGDGGEGDGDGDGCSHAGGREPNLLKGLDFMLGNRILQTCSAVNVGLEEQERLLLDILFGSV